MFLVYYVYYSLWPVFGTTVLQLVFMLYLMGLKFYLEEFASGNIPSADRGISQDYSPGAALLPADQLIGQKPIGDEETTGHNGRPDSS